MEVNGKKYKIKPFARLHNAELSGADLSKADLRAANLENANLEYANLSGANLGFACLSRANLSHANLSHADLSNANLDGPKLSFKNIGKGNLQYPNQGSAILQSANLENANLEGAKLVGVDLRNANLENANLQKVDLSYAKMAGANLSHADLSHAVLSGADLSKADLSKADLSGANLRDVNLTGATMPDGTRFNSLKEEMSPKEQKRIELPGVQPKHEAQSRDRNSFVNRKAQTIFDSISDKVGFGIGFTLGLLGPIKSDLTQVEIEQILDKRTKSELAGIYLGEIYPPRLRDWIAGLLAVFNDGSGSIFWVLPKANGQSHHNFACEKSWGPGNPSNEYNDPTPLLIGPLGVPFEEAKTRYLPRSTTPILNGETIIVFENLSNDFDSDGENSWVSGASQSQGAVFRATVYGQGLSVLRKRCANRKPW